VAFPEQEKIRGVVDRGAGYGAGVQVVHVSRQFIAEAQHLFHFFEPAVLASGFFELHLAAERVAGGGDPAEERASAGA